MNKDFDAHLYIAGDPTRARSTLEAAFGQRGWKLQPNPDGWSGKATKGSKVLNVLFGALAQYHEILYGLIAMPDGNTDLHLYRAGSGMAGGLIGMSSVKKHFRTIVMELQGVYHQAGVLLGSAGM